MSEFGFRARDSGLPNTKGTGPLLMTQTQRAAAYRRYIETLVGLPFVVGYHMFMWMDEPAGGQLFGANSNFGLVHLSDDPYQVLTDAFTEITRWRHNGISLARNQCHHLRRHRGSHVKHCLGSCAMKGSTALNHTRQHSGPTTGQTACTAAKSNARNATALA